MNGVSKKYGYMKKMFYFCCLLCFMLILAGCQALPSSLNVNPVPIADNVKDVSSSSNLYDTEKSGDIEDATNTDFPDNIAEFGADVSVPYPVDNIDEIVRDIDNRVSWIIEQRGSFINNDGLAFYDGNFTYADGDVYKDYFDGKSLVYREGDMEYYDEIEGPVFYKLYYGIDGRLVFAEITQYRHPFYFIYFERDKAIRLIAGDIGNSEEEVFDDLMVNAISLCLENAYR